MRLIVNGDDFGYSPGQNYGIVEAYQKGILALHLPDGRGDGRRPGPGTGPGQPRAGSGGSPLAPDHGRPLSPPQAVPSLLPRTGPFGARPLRGPFVHRRGGAGMAGPDSGVDREGLAHPPGRPPSLPPASPALSRHLSVGRGIRPAHPHSALPVGGRWALCGIGSCAIPTSAWWIFMAPASRRDSLPTSLPPIPSFGTRRWRNVSSRLSGRLSPGGEQLHPAPGPGTAGPEILRRGSMGQGE